MDELTTPQAVPALDAGLTVLHTPSTRSKPNAIEKHPGQPTHYLVVDDDARQAERVRLPYEDIEGYDAEYYVEQLLRATESVVSPLGWDRRRVDRYRRDAIDVQVTAFERG